MAQPFKKNTFINLWSSWIDNRKSWSLSNINMPSKGFTLDNIKYYLNLGRPLRLCIGLNKNFEMYNNIITNPYKFPQIPLNLMWYDDGKQDSNITGYHAVTIVGYSDCLTPDGSVGVFKIANSWSTLWGDAGYFYITYNWFFATTNTGVGDFKITPHFSNGCGPVSEVSVIY